MIKKWNQKNMKECVKETALQAANFIRSIYRLIMVDTLLLRPSLHLLTLHFFPNKLHPTILHYPLIWLNPI